MKRLAAGILAALAATAPVLAEQGPGRALLAANTLQIADNAVQSATDGNGVSVTFIPPYSGTVRVKWDIKSKDGTAVLGQAGAPQIDECTKQTTSTAYVTQTCDVRVAGGMPVSIFAFAEEATNTVFLRNVSLSYKIVDFDGKAIMSEAPGAG